MNKLFLSMLDLNKIKYKVIEDKIVIKVPEGIDASDVASIVHCVMIAIYGTIQLGVAKFEK